MKLQKRNGTYWLQADRRATVDDKSSVNMLTGFSLVQMAPTQKGGSASSTDVAEQLQNTAVARKTSKESVSIEQGQPLRAAEPDQCALKVRAKPIPETPTRRQRDIHDFTHLPPVSWCPACLYGKAADDPHRRRQDTGESGLDVASLDHADISAKVGMANKKLKFKVLVSHSSGSVAAMQGPRDVTEYMVRFDCDMLETWCFGVCILKCQKRTSRDCAAERCCSGQGKSRQFRETRPGIRMAVWVTVNQLSKRWRNRYAQCCFKRTLITTAALTSFLRSCPFFLGWSDTLHGRSHGTQSKLMGKRHFSS